MNENIMDIPLLLPILICIIVPIPSIFIGLFLVFIMITNSSITMDVVNIEDVVIPYRRNKTKKKVNKNIKNVNTYVNHTKISKDEEGFNIIDIM